MAIFWLSEKVQGHNENPADLHMTANSAGIYTLFDVLEISFYSLGKIADRKICLSLFL